MIKAFNRENMRSLCQDIDEALKLVLQKHGVSGQPVTVRFDDRMATVKTNISIINSDGVAETKERRAFARYCRQFGFEVSDLDRTTVANGTAYKIDGLRNSQRTPVLATRVADGKQFYLSALMAKEGLPPK